MDGEDPARRSQATLVGDFALVEVIAGFDQRDGQAVGGNDGFQVGANHVVEGFEALVQLVVLVDGHTAGVRLEGEGAQRAGQPRQLEVQRLRVAAVGVEHVAQGGQSRVDGVQHPEVGDVAGGVLGPGTAAGALGGAEGGAFLFQDIDQPAQDRHQPFAGADGQAGRDEGLVEDETAHAVAAQAGVDQFQRGQQVGLGSQRRRRANRVAAQPAHHVVRGRFGQVCHQVGCPQPVRLARVAGSQVGHVPGHTFFVGLQGG